MHDSDTGHSALAGLRVLVVDDHPESTAFFVELLGDHGIDSHGETDPLKALARIAAEDFDVVVTDVEMPGLRGPELMARVHAIRPEQLVILMTAFGSIELAVKTLRAGAVDFLAKPFPGEALLMALERAVKERALRREVIRLQTIIEAGDTGDLVALSPAMKKVLEKARRAARAQTTVLLTGPSGVGKTSVAAFIHRISPRANGPFISLNCASLPVSLAEAELFGARRGAFTGATDDRDGLFVRANGGTLFLDEIGELPLEVQPKLLDVLETGRVRALGASREVTTDARLIAATNTSLEDAIESRTFRADLYFRLNIIRIEIPPLSARKEDLPGLINALVKRAAKRAGREVSEISKGAFRMLLNRSWPGNVRELANVIERAVVLSETACLGEDDFMTGAPTPGTDTMADAVQQRLPLEQVERAYIQRVLDSVGGVKVEAARILGIDRRTLYRKLDLDP